MGGGKGFGMMNQQRSLGIAGNAKRESPRRRKNKIMNKGFQVEEFA